MEAFIIVANISKLNGLDISKTRQDHLKLVYVQTSIELQEID